MFGGCVPASHPAHFFTHRLVGMQITFPVFGSVSIMSCSLLGRSSVRQLVSVKNGCPSSTSKLAVGTTWTWNNISPAPKSNGRFSMTPSISSVEVLMDSMVSLWSDLSGIPPNVCQTECGITMHSAPWSRMQERICPWCITALIHLSDVKCSATMRPSSLLCRHPSYFFKKSCVSGMPDSSLMETVLTVMRLVVVRSLNTLHMSVDTVISSHIGMLIVESSMQSTTCLSASLSSSRKVYLYCVDDWLAGESLGIVTLHEEGEEEIVSCMDEDPAGVITTVPLLGALLGFDPAALTCGEVTSSTASATLDVSPGFVRTGTLTPLNCMFFPLSLQLARPAFTAANASHAQFSSISNHVSSSSSESSSSMSVHVCMNAHGSISSATWVVGSARQYMLPRIIALAPVAGPLHKKLSMRCLKLPSSCLPGIPLPSGIEILLVLVIVIFPL